MQDFFLELWNSYSKTVISLAYNGILAIAVFLASKILAAGARKAIDKFNSKCEQLDETLVPMLRSTVTYTIYGLGLIVILDIFGVNTASFIALLGAAGLAIGLALKDTLQNIAAGIMLLALRPFRTGEYIDGGGVSGTIKEINIFTTILQTPDGIFISAPNSSLWNSEIRNYTRNGTRRLQIVVGIAYDDNMDDGIKALQKVVESDSRVLAEPAPQFMVQSLGDSSVNLQLRVWTTVDDYWDAHWDMNKKVKEEIEAAGLTIPFPQRDVHIFRDDTARV